MRWQRCIKSELRELVTYDQLTQVYTKRVFLTILEREFELALRNTSNYALIFLDIDYFKKINDQYGHLFGDLALTHVTTIVKDAFRSGDFVGRFGSEEFIGALPLTDSKGAAIVAEKIRKQIAESPIKVFGQTLCLTVSLGVSSYTIGSIITELTMLLEDADAALYLSKNEGRNRVSLGALCIDTV